MAFDLQAQHREYSRKKRAVFQHLVGEVYDSYKTELGLAEQNRPTQATDREEREERKLDKERWLPHKEQERLEKDREDTNKRM